MIDILFPVDDFCPLVPILVRYPEQLLFQGWDHWTNGEVTPYYIPYVPIRFSLVPMFPPMEQVDLQDIEF